MTFFTRGLVRSLVLRYTKTATAMYLNEFKKKTLMSSSKFFGFLCP